MHSIDNKKSLQICFVVSTILLRATDLNLLMFITWYMYVILYSYKKAMCEKTLVWCWKTSCEGQSELLLLSEQTTREEQNHDVSAQQPRFTK